MKKNCILMSILSLFIFSHFASADSFTELSVKTSSLDIGMPLNEVFKILSNPDWAVLPDDTGRFTLKGDEAKLELYWHNPGCSPVVVKFNYNLTVIDWDEGINYCGSDAHSFNPADDYSCSKPDRLEYCR